MRQVFQFKISLQEIEPLIWRRIQISDLCTFWSLHVAIQDALGWQDCHLHEFTVIDPLNSATIKIGIPFDDDPDEYRPLAGWELKVAPFLKNNMTMLYEYDFGDNWQHTIEFEGKFDKEPGTKYPVCLDGARHCPPEDVGSSCGYAMFLESIKDKKHPEHKANLRWIGGKFDPEHFSIDEIKFDNPSYRLNRMLEE